MDFKLFASAIYLLLIGLFTFFFFLFVDIVCPNKKREDLVRSQSIRGNCNASPFLTERKYVTTSKTITEDDRIAPLSTSICYIIFYDIFRSSIFPYLRYDVLPIL